MIKSKFLLFLFLLSLLPAQAMALEGDWEVGGDADAFLMPDRDIYGGGVDIFARYSVLDGFSVGGGVGIFGARNTDLNDSFALYKLNVGAAYTLDVLQWVPGVGIQFSALFAEEKGAKFHHDGHGLAIDFEAFVQYRGIRQLGIALVFKYSLVFVDDDYMTVGVRISWFSGIF